jgi:anti-anti-sigma factor
MAVTRSVTRAIGSIEDRGAPLILDLGELTFIDSCGLRAILDARRRAEAIGYEIRVVGARQAVRRVFELTGTMFVIDEPETVRAAGQASVDDRSGLADATGDESHA